MERTRRAQGRGGRRSAPARPDLYRPAPASRGDFPAGLRRAAPGWPPVAPCRPDDRHRGPQHPHAGHRQADRRPDQPHPDRDAAQELRRIRRAPALARRQGTGHCPRGGPAARADPAGHDGRLRRLAHLNPWRLRRTGLRHRHLRGRARHGDPVAFPEAIQDHGHQRRGHPEVRRDVPRTSSWPSLPRSAPAAARGTCWNTAARPSARCPWTPA